MNRSRWRDQLLALAAILAICGAMCALAAAGETQRVLVRPGLVEIRLPDAVAQDADITWEAREPLTLDYRSYEGGTVLVTYMTSGQAVLVSDVIDWQAKKRDRTTWILFVQAGPGPGPAPSPTVPPGIAQDVLKAAQSIAQPQVSRRFAEAFRTASSEIGAGRLRTLDEVKARILELCKGIAPGSAPWQAVGTLIGQHLTATAKTPAEAKQVFDQVVLGLDAAGGA